MDSIKYDGPILIDDASSNDNVYSARTDCFIGFNQSVFDISGFVQNLPLEVPKTLMDKATIVRAMCIYEDGEYSDISSQIYFVGYDDKSGYENMPICSIITNPDNLFDYETGIYVIGKTWTEWWSSLTDHKGVYPYGGPVNYVKKGKDWRRQAIVSFWDSGHKCILEESCDISIQGASTRHSAKKSFNIFPEGKTVFDLSQLGFRDDLGSISTH